MGQCLPGTLTFRGAAHLNNLHNLLNCALLIGWVRRLRCRSSSNIILRHLQAFPWVSAAVEVEQDVELFVAVLVICASCGRVPFGNSFLIGLRTTEADGNRDEVGSQSSNIIGDGYQMYRGVVGNYKWA